MTNRVMILLHVKRLTLRYILSAVGFRELVRGSPSKGSLPDVTHRVVDDTHTQKNQLPAWRPARCTLLCHGRLSPLPDMRGNNQ